MNGAVKKVGAVSIVVLLIIVFILAPFGYGDTDGGRMLMSAVTALVIVLGMIVIWSTFKMNLPDEKNGDDFKMDKEAEIILEGTSGDDDENFILK